MPGNMIAGESRAKGGRVIQVSINDARTASSNVGFARQQINWGPHNQRRWQVTVLSCSKSYFGRSRRIAVLLSLAMWQVVCKGIASQQV